MLKRLAYIVLLLIFAVSLSSAKTGMAHHEPVKGGFMRYDLAIIDTTKKQKAEDDSKKIKEISKAKRQVKPEKISDKDADKANKPKPKRERRPEGLDRPPEIPRRNGN